MQINSFDFAGSHNGYVITIKIPFVKTKVGANFSPPEFVRFKNRLAAW